MVGPSNGPCVFELPKDPARHLVADADDLGQLVTREAGSTLVERDVLVGEESFCEAVPSVLERHLIKSCDEIENACVVQVDETHP